VGRAGRNEIYAYGLRNPWRFSFDRRTGDLYIGDVGQNEIEEIDFASRGQARGRNFGWSCFEGRSRYDSSRSCPGAVGPVLQYGRDGGECSVTGGVVARDSAVPDLAGRYVYGDFCAGRLRSFRIQGGRAARRVAELVRRGRARAGLRHLARRPGLPVPGRELSAPRRAPARQAHRPRYRWVRPRTAEGAVP
jgi:glucose/arabinose dehydrogenase